MNGTPRFKALRLAEFFLGIVLAALLGTACKPPPEELSPTEKQSREYYKTAYQLDHGKGTQQDKAQAAEWYMKAANLGHAHAQYRLGWMFRTGEGLPKNLKMAFLYYSQAAEQDHANAQTMLALMHVAAEAGPRDLAQAYKWAYLADKKANIQASRLLVQIRKEISKTELEAAEREVEQFIQHRKKIAEAKGKR